MDYTLYGIDLKWGGVLLVCFLKPREFDIFRLCASVASRVDCCLTRKRAIRRDLNAFFPTPRRTLVSTHKRRVDGRLNISFFAAIFMKKTSERCVKNLLGWGLEMDRRMRQTRARRPTNCDARSCNVRKCFCCIISLHSRTRKTLAAVAVRVFVRVGFALD